MKIRYLFSLLPMLCISSSSWAQSTRSQMNTFNNTYVIGNGIGAITGNLLNVDLSEMITSMGVLNDANGWTGANTFTLGATFGGVATFNNLAQWTATTNCGSLASSTKCLSVVDPNGHTLFIPVYGAF